MKREIKAIGRFWAIDKEGYIVNTASINLMSKLWQPVVNDIIEIYKNNLSTQLKSIYLRGSVACGSAVLSFSDIDTFALIDSETNEVWRWKKACFQPLARAFLQEKYPFVRDVEMQLSTFHKDTFAKHNPNLAMVIKTQAICIYGNDIAPTIKKYKPNHEVCLNYRWLEADINDFLAKTNSSKPLTQKDCSELMKIIVRVGMEIIVDKTQQFTMDLYPCYQSFSTHFPKKEREMRQALEWYLNPITDKIILKNYLNTFGKWLVGEVTQFKSQLNIL